jgi:hypothetical protein
MGVKCSRLKKDEPINTVEMEIAVSKLFEIRKHIIVPNLSWGFVSHECDLFLIKKSGYAVEVEIKISFSDFMKDFEKKHQHKEKQNKICEFYYAIPYDLQDKCIEHIPDNAGIIICKRNETNDNVRASIKRKAKRIKNSRKLTIEEQFKVASLGCMRIWGLKSKLAKLKNK